MKKENFTGILEKEHLKFKDNKEVENYYEHKYKNGGYKGGYILFGRNISKIYHKERQKSALKFSNPQKSDIILDAGCGRGNLSYMLSKKCHKVYAVDIAGNALENKYKRIKNIHFKKMNIEELNFQNNFFDKIVCVETLEHLIYPKKAIKELRRVLKKEGILVITYPTVNTTLAHKLQLKLKISKHFPISEHLTEWDYNSLIINFENEGFKVIKSEGLVFDFGYLGRIKTWSKLLSFFITDLSLKIRRFPSNSSFVSIVFKKI